MLKKQVFLPLPAAEHIKQLHSMGFVILRLKSILPNRNLRNHFNLPRRLPLSLLVPILMPSW